MGKSFYLWRKATQLPTPGAMDQGFASEYLADRPMIGPAYALRKPLRTLSPNMTQSVGTVAITGVGGLATGSMVMQPLVDPYEDSD